MVKYEAIEELLNSNGIVTGYRIGVSNDTSIVKTVQEAISMIKCGTKIKRLSIDKNGKLKFNNDNKSRDLTGMQFGEWKVLGYDGNRLWRCKCSCGNIKNVQDYTLLKGLSTSCRHPVRDGNNVYVGAKINYWTVLEDLGYGMFKCQCSCEKKTIRNVNISSLRYGYSKSCGCRHGEYKNQTSIMNYELLDYVIGIYGDSIDTNNNEIYVSEYNIVILYTSNEISCRDYNKSKYKLCRSKGIRLINIFEYEWNNNRDGIKQYLRDVLCDGSIVYARNTDLCLVSDNESKVFEEANHLQGYVKAGVNIGLKYKDELVGIMTFSSPRFDKQCDAELIRLCFKTGTSVVGGAERMFKYFIDRYNVKNIVSYCNISKFSGNIYSRLGFNLEKITEPNYVWVSCDGKIVLSRYQTMKHKLISKGIGTNEKTEDEIMKSNGYLKVYDCGNLKFIWSRGVKGIDNI